MSLKAERGTKRLCPSCSSKFYDLNRDPIVCPICQNVYKTPDGVQRVAIGGNALDADDDAVLDAGGAGIVFVPLDEVAAAEGEDLGEIEGGDIADAEEGAADPLDTADDEAFLEAEDEGEADVTGFAANGGNEDEV